MNIDRYMVNLFFEIRRNIPHEYQRQLKISSHDVCDTLIELHDSIDDENIKLLVQLFLERADKSRINNKGNNSATKKQDEKIVKKKSKRIYRGVEI